MTNKRKGVTLLETVIAMFLITIITGGAFGVCSQAAVIIHNAVDKFDAQYACEDYIECFKAASTFSQFEDLLHNVAGQSKHTSSDDSLLHTYTIDYDNFAVTVQFSRTNTSAQDLYRQQASVSVSAKSTDGKELYQNTYSKGDDYAQP